MHPGKAEVFERTRRIAWIVRCSVLAVSLTGVAGCGSGDAGGDGHAAEADEDIFGGVRDDDGTAKSAVVALRIKRANNYELCSGTLVAPNIVLTARHCVAQILTDSVSCTEEGTSSHGMEHFTADEPPENIGIFLGASPSFSKSPVASGRAIIAPPGNVLCNADVALLVLDKEIPDIAPLAIRMTANARVGESIRAVGYGANDAKTPMGTRFRRDQVPVLAVGKGISESATRLGPNEFEVGKSICEGDSGGPAISELTGAVIGVVSRGGDCSDDYGHVYTAPSGFKDLFDRAFAEAGGGQPVLEQNTPPENVEPEQSVSSSSGAPNASDPASAGGCASAPGHPAGSSSLLVAVGAALALAAGRRRRASTPRGG